MARSESITGLALSGPNLTDLSVKSLAERKRPWRNLALWDSKLTDASVPLLSKMKSLDGLDVTNSQITPEGLALLRKALPSTSIRPAVK